MSLTFTGKMSTFGGPNDKGVGAREGLAVYPAQKDIASAPAELFLATQPKGTSGTGRRLNPDAYYVACRWNYKYTPLQWLRKTQVVVTNPQTGRSASAYPVDWGPNSRTGRVADLSPGLARALGLETDDKCSVTVPLASDAASLPAAPVPSPAPGPALPVHNVWPLQGAATAFYGDPYSAGFLHANTVDVPCPWPLHMGKLAITNILINKKCADSLRRVLGAVWDAVGHDVTKIKQLRYDVYDGSYALRNKRGGSSLSMHAYAAAIDWDAADNAQHSQHHLFTDQSLLVVKFKEEGWIWGGDWSPGSIDAMHVQAARIHA